MSALDLIPLPLLEQLGVNIIQQAADAALGAGTLKFTFDNSGLSLGLPISGGKSINLKSLSTGPQGFSGRIFVDGISAANALSATLFDGFTVGLTAFDITFAHGGVSASHIGGQLTIPFFTDHSGHQKKVDIEIGFKADGTLSITLAAVETGNPTTTEGLVQLVYDIGGGAVTIEIDLASLEIDREPDSTWRIVLSGNLLVTTADLQWPSFELRGLGIDTNGHISIDGGWINLPSQTALDFYGFHIALQRLGFGSDGGGRWIGFNGDISLVEGLSLGGSVRGLRINLDTGAVSFDGVGISFEIPDVLTIDGEIDHIHLNANTPDDLSAAGLLPSLFNVLHNPPGQPVVPTPIKIDVFAGQVKVVVQAAGNLEVDAHFIVGHFGGVSVFFLDLACDLPVGIPIFLDVSLYGLEGLVASNLQPDPEATGHTWWEWYKYPTDATGINTSGGTDYNATDVQKWLAPKQGAFAIGAGATIGTSADDGFTVSAAVTFVLLLPGPVISLIGKANILSKRIGSATEQTNFEAMATFDGNAGTFDLTIDAQYQIPVILDIEGTAELFVDVPSATWFFALGKPPHDKRIKARIFDLFETDAYFVVSDSGLITGTWTGYKNSWSFGPLSVSIDAYLATLLAIQWSPLQFAGGIELHGEVHLSAFGIGMGLTADALLEGCAPNPFWVHGEVSVELDLPWPLPNVGATVSLSWGGDDGSIPPSPLALNHIDATLSDHANAAGTAASDHYALLAHRPGGPWPNLTVQYDDPNKPGLLNIASGSRTATALPDMAPSAASNVQLAPAVPQDSHFTLTFAHPVVDLAQFNLATPEASLPKEIVTAGLPSTPIVGKDDMSNISPQPPAPAVGWLHRLSLLEVALYEWDGSAWQLVCSKPETTKTSTRMDGVWLSLPKTDPTQTQTQLKVFTYSMLPGPHYAAAWPSAAQSAGTSFGTDFMDQGLGFTTSGIQPVKIGSVSGLGTLPGLEFTLIVSGSGAVTIQFATPVQINSIVSFNYIQETEFTNFFQPDWLGNGNTMAVSSASQDSSTQAWTQYFSGNPAIRQLSPKFEMGTLMLYSIDYQLPDIPMAILPDAPALYAIRTVTQLEVGRQNGGAPAYQIVPGGQPVVEFAYLQAISGPGTAMIGQPAPAAPLVPALLPVPAQTAPFPNLAANCDPKSGQQTASSFPLGGALNDLTTYTQWSWPLDGSTAAYYGYDVNVEFEETYVNALYMAFSGGLVRNSLHFRCFDRNGAHSLLQPVAIHVPSIYQASALVAKPLMAPLPATVAQPPTVYGVLSQSAQQLLAQRAAMLTDDFTPLPFKESLAQASTSIAALNGRAGGLAVSKIGSGVAGFLRHQWLEEQAAAEVRALWFKPLLPSTRYTLDVVAGPFLLIDRYKLEQPGSPPGLQAIFAAKDAIGALAALKAYLTYEDSLTTLERVQFTTSRYATFSEQMANARLQIKGAPGATPIRHYVAATDPRTWLADPAHGDQARVDALTEYGKRRDELASVVADFDPLADDRRQAPAPPPTPDLPIPASPHGPDALVIARMRVGTQWSIFDRATAASFDGLIAALGRPDLASNSRPVPLPDTEVSLFTSADGDHVLALLIESPEPQPWRRIWQWITLSPAGILAGGLRGQFVLWNGDGTRGLLVPQGNPRGSYNVEIAFQGNIGAEAPSITVAGNALTEPVSLGALTLGPVLWRPGRLGGID